MHLLHFFFFEYCLFLNCKIIVFTVLSADWSCFYFVVCRALLAAVLPLGFVGFAQVDGVLIIALLALPHVQLLPEDFTRDAQEHLLDVEVVLCGRLEQFDLHRAGEAFRVLGEYDFSFWFIVFVPHKHFIYNITILFNFVQPSLHIRERFTICHIVDHNYTMGASIVRASNCSKSFLPCCVPYLQLNSRAIHIHRAYLEVHADCGDITAVECVIGEAQQQRAFAHPAIANY